MVVGTGLLAFACGGNERHQRYEEAGQFSYEPPADWVPRDFPGQEYKVCVEPIEGVFAPNIIVGKEEFAGSLTEFVDKTLAESAPQFAEFELIKREKYLTREDVPVEYIIITNVEQGRRLRQTFFSLKKKDLVYVLGCSVLAETGSKYDSLFRDCIATFRLH
jgi:hypothetical protein